MTYSKILLSGILSFLYLTSIGQVGVDYDLKKPKKWENRTLASETANNGKKFRKFRHFVQNNITHYNYYFNANEKIKLIVALNPTWQDLSEAWGKTMAPFDESHLKPATTF